MKSLLNATVNFSDITSIGAHPTEIENADAPIFVTGFARSGTTWVNRLMRDYFDAGFVNEGQFIISFGKRLERYGDLRKHGNRRHLLEDLRKDKFFSILKQNYAIEIDWSQVGTVSPEYAAIVLDILKQIASLTKKIRIGSKYPVFGCYLDLLNELFPRCRVVHVIRDGRDCALSHKRMAWGYKNTYAAAVHWRDYIHKARSAARNMPGRYLEVCYEDLLLGPESSMARLEEFLTGVPGGSVTQRFMNDANLFKPDRTNRWREAMTPRALAIFEGVAGDTLQQCGYILTGSACKTTVISGALYAAHDRLSREAWHWVRKAVPSIPEYRR